MKKIYLIAACTIALLSACKSPKTIQQETGAVEIKLPFSEKEFQTNKEFFRATNMGKSPDIATSKKVALLNAKSELASNINSTIKKVTESYTNQRSVADKQDFENKFEENIREVVNYNLQNVIVKGEKLFKEPNGSYTFHVAIELNKEGILEGISNKISKNESLKLDYDKMKFEKIFNEEMEKLEKEQ